MTSKPRVKNALTRASEPGASKRKGRRPGRPFSDENFDGREALLTTAHELLQESHGLPVSMNLVCERAGVNQAMVSYHFGGKHELMVALFERVSATWGPPLEELLELDVEPTRKLEIHIRQIVRNYQKYPYISRLLTELQLTSDPELQKRLSNSFVDDLLKFYGQIIKDGVAEGTMRKIEPVNMFLSIVGMCEYLHVAMPMLGAGLGIKVDDEFEASFVKHTTTLVLEGVTAKR